MAISKATKESELMSSRMKRMKTISDIANRMHANAQLPRPRDIQHIDWQHTLKFWDKKGKIFITLNGTKKLKKKTLFGRSRRYNCQYYNTGVFLTYNRLLWPCKLSPLTSIYFPFKKLIILNIVLVLIQIIRYYKLSSIFLPIIV